jgi:heptaprenyl diphosphate synthase
MPHELPDERTPASEVTHNERIELTAFLGAVCMFFATIEYLFPKPVPFFRLGLANLPILLSLEFFSFRYILLLVTLKVLGQALINGTLASYVFLFSAAGSVASGLMMYAAHRGLGDRISLFGVSIFGALASNVVQILLSITFIFGQAAWVIAPVLLGLGVFSSILVGLFARTFSAQSRWFALVKHRYGG